MSDKSWKLKRNNGYEDYYVGGSVDAFWMIQEQTDASYVEKKIDLLRDLVAHMFDALSEEKQVEIMEAVNSNWRLE